jgi:transposase-like protein
MFKRRRFDVDIILVCVRWHCKYGISYRELAEMMQERGVDVDPSYKATSVQATERGAIRSPSLMLIADT